MRARVLLPLLLLATACTLGVDREDPSAADSDPADYTFVGKYAGTAGTLDTEAFSVSGGRIKIELNVERGSERPDLASAYVTVQGDPDRRQVGMVSRDGVGRVESVVRLEPGRYYLHVSSFNGPWAVAIYQAD